MKKFKLVFFILSVFFFISCKKENLETINLYIDSELKNVMTEIVEKYERKNKINILIKSNVMDDFKDADIIITNDDRTEENMEDMEEGEIFFKDNVVIIGRKKISNLNELSISKIAIPNYKTNTGKMAVELLSTSDKFDIIANNIVYKHDVIDALQSVDLYEIDFGIVTKLSSKMLKNSIVCYNIPIENEKNFEVFYSKHIKNNSNDNVKNFYNYLSEEYVQNKLSKYE